MATDSSLQEHLRNPFADSMDMRTAEAILNLHSSSEVQAYAADLAEKSREGLLTPRTMWLLQMNAPRRVQLRELLIEDGDWD